MKYKFEELKDITDSKEMIKSPPKGFCKYMTYIIFSLIIVVTIWSLVSYKEITVKVNGIVRQVPSVNYIYSEEAGNITEIDVKDGEEVNKGDILLIIDGERYKERKEILQKQKIIKEEELKKQKENGLEDKVIDLVDEIYELNIKQEDLENEFKDNLIKADSSGIINFSLDLNIGDFMDEKTEIASIVPKGNQNFNLEIYIPEQDFSQVKEGDNLLISFTSCPYKDYGYMELRLDNISKDIRMDKNASYYIGKCSINNPLLIDKKGNRRELNDGMTAQASIATDKVTYFKYFLEKLNIIKE